MIGYHTLLGMNSISDAFENSLIFHIPHSKTEIPDQFKPDFVSAELMENEIKLLDGDSVNDKHVRELNHLVSMYTSTSAQSLSATAIENAVKNLKRPIRNWILRL